MKSSAHDLYGCRTRCSCSLLDMRPLRPNCTVHLCSSNTGGGHAAFCIGISAGDRVAPWLPQGEHPERNKHPSCNFCEETHAYKV